MTWDWSSKRALVLVDVCDTDTGDRIRVMGGRSKDDVLYEFPAHWAKLVIDNEFIKVIDELLPDAVEAASEINMSHRHDRIEAGLILGEDMLLKVLRAFLREILR